MRSCGVAMRQSNHACMVLGRNFLDGLEQLLHRRAKRLFGRLLVLHGSERGTMLNDVVVG